MRVTAPNKFKFLIAINSIQARGGTNIENGMHMAFSVLRHRRYKNPVAAIFLLSGFLYFFRFRYNFNRRC